MKNAGYEVCKRMLEIKHKAGKMTREELFKNIKKLKQNYQTGIARKELELAGINNWRSL